MYSCTTQQLSKCWILGSVCLPWLPHVREHSVHDVQSESMQLMGQSTTQLSDSVHLLTRPSCRKTSKLVRTGCSPAWFQVFREWIISDQVILLSTRRGNKLKLVCVKLSGASWKWKDILAQGGRWKTGAQYLWKLAFRASMRILRVFAFVTCSHIRDSTTFPSLRMQSRRRRRKPSPHTAFSPSWHVLQATIQTHNT